jgi:hypothetical protein
MVDAGLLELAEAGPAARNPGSAKPPVPPVAMSGGVGSERSTSERYQAGYLIATELTAALGLRGFRLHLAVEGATGFESLAALAPRIREAVGADKCARLEHALFG